MTRNKVCEQVAGRSTRCLACAKAKQSCKYLISAASATGEQVGPVLDAAEKSDADEDGEGDEEEEEPPVKKTSPIATVIRKMTSPLRNLGKRKTAELSPGSVQERDAEPDARVRSRAAPSIHSIETPEPSRGSSFYSSAMPPPSTVVSSQNPYRDEFYIRRLETDLQSAREDNAMMNRRLRDSYEDLSTLTRRYESKESLLYEEISTLKAQLRGGSSRGGRGAGSSSGRY